MSSNDNPAPQAPEVLLNGARCDVVRRQTFDEMTVAER